MHIHVSVHTQEIKELKSSLQALEVEFCINNANIYPIKFINKMRLEAGALKVKRLIAKKGSIALEVSMGTKRAPTTQHCHTERVQWNTYHNPYLPIRGWQKWEQNQQISQAVNSGDPQRSAKQSRAEICNLMSARANQVAILHKPACLGLNRWPTSIV